MDIQYEKPVGIKIVGALTGTKIDAKRAKQPLSEDVKDDPEIDQVISAINKSLEAAKLANKQHQVVVAQIKLLEEEKNEVKAKLVAAQAEVVRLKSKVTGGEDALSKSQEELELCKSKLEQSNKTLEKLKGLEELVETQKKEIQAAAEAAEKEATTAKRRKLITGDLIEKLKNDAYNMEVKHKKEFDAKVEELDDLRAKFKGLEISLKKQEEETSLRTTEKNELNAGLINAKKKLKGQRVEISALQSKIKMKDKVIKEDEQAVKKSEDELRLEKARAKAAVDEAMRRASKAEQDAAIAEKKRSVLEADYKSAKKAMKKMKEDGTAACINPEPKNQPILAGKVEEQTEYLGYYIRGQGEGMYHPHDFKKIDGKWKDETSRDRLEVFARMEGRWNGIRRQLIESGVKPGKALPKQVATIFGDPELPEYQAARAKEGRKAKGRIGGSTPYITVSDPMYGSLFSKTITYASDGELRKLYDELTKEGRKEAKNSVNPQGPSLLNNIQLKF